MAHRRSIAAIAAIVAVAALSACVPLPGAVPPAPPVVTTPPQPSTPAVPAPSDPATPTPSTPAPTSPDAGGSWTPCSDEIVAAMADGSGYVGTGAVEPGVASDFGQAPICFVNADGVGANFTTAYFAGAESTASALESSLVAAGWDASAFGAAIFGAKGEEWSVVGSQVDPSVEPTLLPALGVTEAIQVIIIGT